MEEKTKWGKKYHVSKRKETPNEVEEQKVCELCGRKMHICGVSDCERHFHEVEIIE